MVLRDGLVAMEGRHAWLTRAPGKMADDGCLALTPKRAALFSRVFTLVRRPWPEVAVEDDGA